MVWLKKQSLNIFSSQKYDINILVSSISIVNILTREF